MEIMPHRPVPIVARAKRVVANLKHVRLVSSSNIVMSPVKKLIVNNIKKNVGNAQRRYTMRNCSNSPLDERNVLSVSYGCHRSKWGGNITHAVEKLSAVDVPMQVQKWMEM